MLDRKKINLIRYILEDIVPPFFRDSRFFLALMYLVYGKSLKKFVTFRENVLGLSESEYKEYYQMFSPVMAGTDLNQKSIDQIIQNVEGLQCIDVGCGRGFLANEIAKKRNIKVVGVDINIEGLKETENISYISSLATKLPFPDQSFDTVICTHTLEHLIDFDKAVSELRRVAKRRLIIVVPKEREYKYSFNLHVSFFPYLHSFINRIKPIHRYVVLDLDGDIYYQEDH